MVGTTAQLVALACHYNGRVRGLHLAPFLPSNSTAKFCEDIRFFHQRRGWFGRTLEWAVTADTPDEWIAREARAERKAIICHHAVNDPRVSDRMSAGFVGGGGRWRLNLVAEGRMDVWESTWEVGNREAPQQRIWRVKYELTAEKAKAATLTFEPPEAFIPLLQRALIELLAFCEDHQIASFAQFFRRAMECLTADDPFALAYHQDLAPEGLLSLSAKRVLAACQAAWVFGGMGSWNDLGFEGHEQSRYERISAGLFTLLNTAIAASANSACNLGCE